MQPPSLLSSLSEITEWQEPVPVPRRYRPVVRPHQTAPLPPRDGECGSADAWSDAPTWSSTQLLLRGPQPPSHRWPPGLPGSPLPEPAPPLPLTSGLPHRREPPPDQPGSPR